MKAYELQRDGEIVYTFRSEWTNPDGTQGFLTRGEVGSAGQVFKDLSPHLVEQIESGQKEGVYKVIELPDVETVTSDIPASPEAPTAEPDYAKMEPRDLMEKATERGLDVKGTGAGGNVLKSDVVNALKADDAAKEG